MRRITDTAAPSRRRLLGAALAAGLCAGAPVPDLALTGADGRPARLAALLRGRVTAVQLMFAGCSATCPMQGAVFAEVAQRLPPTGTVQLLSLTVDPLGDTPQALHDWLGRFGRPAHWRAALPRVEDVDVLAAFLRGVPPRAGTHGAQVFLVDRQARLAFRTVELPSAEHVAGLLRQLAAA